MQSRTVTLKSLGLVAPPTLALLSCGGGSSGGGWAANLAVSPTGGTTVAGVPYASSSKLSATWSAPSQPVDHYLLRATDAVNSSVVSVTAAGSSTSATISGLKSATQYTVALTACLDAACGQSLAASSTAASTTAGETWQFVGAAGSSSVSGITKVVSDGNTKPFAIRFGSGAGANLEGKLQLYYDPIGASEKGVKVATLPSAATTDLSSVSSFTPVAGSGLIKPSSGAPLISSINTSQAVPLSSSLGGKVRLFFEATGADGKTRILYLDSQDGFTGQDFHSGPPTSCSTPADYSSGGGCAPSVAIGVEGDSTGAKANVSNARQFKIGYPVLTDWRWDGAAGTFMVFTVEMVSSCSASSRNQGYAVWDGANWNVQYGSGTCPKLFTNMQAPMPVHRGGANYKLYYSDTTRQVVGSQIPGPGPLVILYAEGPKGGDPSLVDFEDWEAQGSARETTFLWPSGIPLTDAEESHIDDYVVLAPTGDPDFQILYCNVSDGSAVPFVGLASWINP